MEEQNEFIVAEACRYDVFLSHSPKDKAVVRAVVKRLRNLLSVHSV